MSSLDEILEDLAKEYLDGDRNRSASLQMRASTEAKAQIKAWVAELIGEDEQLHQIMTKELRQRGGEYAEMLQSEMHGRNKLRAEQRKRLEES